MIVIVTNKTDYTADYLIIGLNERKIDFIRLNTEDFPNNIDIALNINKGRVSGYIEIEDRVVDIRSIRSVWYRRPVPSTPPSQVADLAARDFIVSESMATLEGLWRVLDCQWVSHPDRLRSAESKLYQLKMAGTLGFVIPQTCVTNVPSVAEDFYDQTKHRTIYKPQKGARIVREELLSLIYTNIVEEHHAQHFENVRLCPILLQPYIEKHVEIRVTIVGHRVFAVALDSQSEPRAQHDWRRAGAAAIHHEAHLLPADVEAKCVSLVKILGLAFGAIDLILMPNGEYVFLEINPNGQWAWIQQLCPEIRIREALIDLLVNGTCE